DGAERVQQRLEGRRERVRRNEADHDPPPGRTVSYSCLLTTTTYRNGSSLGPGGASTPPDDRGEHRATLHTARRDPRSAPALRMASSAYNEQVGWKRQVPPAIMGRRTNR